MADDRSVKDTTRDPEREARGRSGIRAAAKKAVKKIAKKAGRKKVTKKAASAAGKTATRGTAQAKKADRTSRVAAGTPAPGTAARGARQEAMADPEAAARGIPGASAESGAPSRELNPSVDTVRPPGPMHPGAAMDSMQEQSAGLGGLLALWGPLIIVGFLVLVFRGGDDREVEVATGAGTPDTVATEAAAGAAHDPDRTAGTGAGHGAMQAAAPSGVAGEAAVPFDGGFAVRTSMAGVPATPGRGGATAPGAPALATPFAAVGPGPGHGPGAPYPPPLGPYRSPRYGGLATGEPWSGDGAGEWMWSAGSGAAQRHLSGRAAPVQWVRCAAPYYWCPAPDSPAW